MSINVYIRMYTYKYNTYINTPSGLDLLIIISPQHVSEPSQRATHWCVIEYFNKNDMFEKVFKQICAASQDVNTIEDQRKRNQLETSLVQATCVDVFIILMRLT